MKNERAIPLDRNASVAIAQFIALIGIAYFAPFFHQQFLTGPIVNATLFIATALLGIRAGIMVGLLPSVIALSFGTLPAPLAPMLPYIMMSNALLVVSFGSLQKKYWTAVAVSSLVKSLFLFTASSVILGVIVKLELADSVSLMMSWPQLVTALFGGVLAHVFLKFYRKG